MSYGKSIEEIKAARLAEESGLHKNTNPMITAYEPKVEKPQEKSKRVAKKKVK
jgi:hypothetical protein